MQENARLAYLGHTRETLEERTISKFECAKPLGLADRGEIHFVFLSLEMDTEDMGSGKLGQILRQIWRQNQMLKRALLGDDLCEGAGGATWTATVIFLGQRLNEALYQLLEHTAGSLRSTCQQLYILLDKDNQCIWRQGK